MRATIFLSLCVVVALSGFSQDLRNRDYTSVKDSLLKKHRKQTPIVYSIQLDQAIFSLFFYKKKGKWHGVMFNDAALVGSQSQYVHLIRMKKFDADTIGKRIVILGIDKLKQFSLVELSKFYNEKMKAIKNPNVEYELPNCAYGGSRTLIFKGKSYTYIDCVTTSAELQTLPEIKRFYDITDYLQVIIAPRIEKLKN